MSNVDDLPELERLIYNTILQTRINKGFRSGFKSKDGKPLSIVPNHALFMTDIMPFFNNIATVDEVKAGLNSLVKKEVVSFGKTINDTYFKIIEYEKYDKK